MLQSLNTTGSNDRTKGTYHSEGDGNYIIIDHESMDSNMSATFGIAEFYRALKRVILTFIRKTILFSLLLDSCGLKNH